MEAFTKEIKNILKQNNILLYYKIRMVKEQLEIQDESFYNEVFIQHYILNFTAMSKLLND
jgi:hypothetical protein